MRASLRERTTSLGLEEIPEFEVLTTGQKTISLPFGEVILPIIC